MKEISKGQLEFALATFVRLYDSRKMTQSQLAAASGVHQSTISKIVSPPPNDEGERYVPTEDMLRKLYQALGGLKLEDVLTETDRMTDKMQGYLATPLTGLSNRADDEVRRVVQLIRQVASEPQPGAPTIELYWPGDHTHPTDNPDIPATQVYVTDRSHASMHDFIVLFCGSPSFGVGQENEIATQAGVPAIRLFPKKVSRMMGGSFISATDIIYSGTLEDGIKLDGDDLRAAFNKVRSLYFRHRAFYRGLNGNSFGPRLRRLIDARCSGDYDQFALDLGISLQYLHNLMDDVFAVSNPSARLLKRMASRLGEHVGYLLGESEEDDPIWIEGRASWRSWIDKTPGIDAAIAMRMKDDWNDEYAVARREQSMTSKRTPPARMKESHWEARYQQLLKASAKEAANANQGRLGY